MSVCEASQPGCHFLSAVNIAKYPSDSSGVSSPIHFAVRSFTLRFVVWSLNGGRCIWVSTDGVFCFKFLHDDFGEPLAQHLSHWPVPSVADVGTAASTGNRSVAKVGNRTVAKDVADVGTHQDTKKKEKKTNGHFDLFWTAYPRKVKKARAMAFLSFMTTRALAGGVQSIWVNTSE